MHVVAGGVWQLGTPYKWRSAPCALLSEGPFSGTRGDGLISYVCNKLGLFGQALSVTADRGELLVWGG